VYFGQGGLPFVRQHPASSLQAAYTPKPPSLAVCAAPACAVVPVQFPLLNKKSNRLLPIAFFRAGGIGFHSQTSCLLFPARPR